MNAPGTDISGLRDSLRAWCEALEALRLTLTEDRPPPGDSALADGLADATDDVIGWLKEAEAGLASAEHARSAPWLIARAVRRQGDALFGHAHHAQLERLARTGGAPWLAWVRAIHAASEPLWARAETTLQHLGGAPASARDPFSHTTYRQTHFCNTDTLNPSAQ
jgi:hypothetical protein